MDKTKEVSLVVSEFALNQASTVQKAMLSEDNRKHTDTQSQGAINIHNFERKHWHSQMEPKACQTDELTKEQ